MKRTRAQQPKAEDPQDANAAAATKPLRRAKQPRQPKAAGAAATKKPAGAARAAAVAAVAANAATESASPGAEMAPTVPDVCAAGEGEVDSAAAAAAGAPHAVDWDLDAGLSAAAWWTWGVEEEKLLGWFPFVEEDFRCGGGRAGDAEVAAFDHDIWSIW